MPSSSDVSAVMTFSRSAPHLVISASSGSIFNCFEKSSAFRYWTSLIAPVSSNISITFFLRSLDCINQIPPIVSFMIGRNTDNISAAMKMPVKNIISGSRTSASLSIEF